MNMFYFKEKTHRRVAPARVNLIPIPVEMQVTSAVASFESRCFVPDRLPCAVRDFLALASSTRHTSRAP